MCIGALDAVGLTAAPTNSNMVQYKAAHCHKAESDTSWGEPCVVVEGDNQELQF